MNLKTLTSDELISKTKALVAEERRVTLSVLDHLREIDVRQVHLKKGYGSLHEFAVSILGYSSAAAHRRIQSMRAMQDAPEIRNKIESGTLNLTQVAMIQTACRTEKVSLAEKRELFTAMVGHSTRETEKMLLTRFPESQRLRESRKEVSATQTEVKIVLSQQALVLIQKLKSRKAHVLRKQTDSEAIELALELALKQIESESKPQRASKYSIEPTAQTSATSSKKIASTSNVISPDAAPAPGNLPAGRRKIPKPWVARAFEKAKYRCEYYDSKTGLRCASEFALEVDHITPIAKDGENTPGNLQILCANHNRWKGSRNNC